MVQEAHMPLTKAFIKHITCPVKIDRLEINLSILSTQGLMFIVTFLCSPVKEWRIE